MESSYSALLGRFEMLKRESLRAAPATAERAAPEQQRNPPASAQDKPASVLMHHRMQAERPAAQPQAPQQAQQRRCELPAPAHDKPGSVLMQHCTPALRRDSAQPASVATLARPGGSPPLAAPAAIPGRIAVSTMRDSVMMLADTQPAAQGRSPTRPEAAAQPEFEAAGRWEAPSLAQAAQELFSEPGFAEQCERGLTMQLRRTKDGATAESRIAELAGAPAHAACQAMLVALCTHRVARHVPCWCFAFGVDVLRKW